MIKQLCFSVLGVMSAINLAYANSFTDRYCNQPGYHCITVKKNETWQNLFHTEGDRDVVMRLNRINTRLSPGMRLAVPDENLNALDISPLNREISPPGIPTIIVDQNELAWGAYSADGELLKWGPTSSGRAYCADIKGKCRTVQGEFTVYNKRGADCISKKFPVGKGGAKMPYCMFFKGGFALHGSNEVPGYNASHGCVRIFVSDAQWLNHNFVDVGVTRVVVLPVNAKSEPIARTSNVQSDEPQTPQNYPGDYSPSLMKGRFYNVYY